MNTIIYGASMQTITPGPAAFHLTTASTLLKDGTTIRPLRLPITPKPASTITPATGPNDTISDIVVLQRYRRLYISAASQTGTWGVEVHSWDISQDPPVHLGMTFVTASGFYDANSLPEAHQRFVDMEIDRSDDVLAGCRILVMFMGQPVKPGPMTLELRKLGPGPEHAGFVVFAFRLSIRCCRPTLAGLVLEHGSRRSAP